MYITSQLSFRWILLALDKEKAKKRERGAHLPLATQGHKGGGGDSVHTWMKKWMHERMKDISVPFSTSISAPLPNSQTTAARDYVHIWRAWKRVLQKQKLILKELHWLHHAECWHKGMLKQCQRSTLSHLPWETLKCNRKNLDFGACKTWAHILSLPLTTVKITGLSWRLNKVTCRMPTTVSSTQEATNEKHNCLPSLNS